MKSKFQIYISTGMIALFLFLTLGFFLLSTRSKPTVFAQNSTTKQEKFNTTKAVENLHKQVKTSREKHLAKLRKQIKGRESEPASKVFKNVKSNRPAGRFLSTMDVGYSRALGVDCTHCHVPDKWESFDNPKKQVAIEMAKMSRTLNSVTLKSVKGIQNPRPLATCTTCHRGEVIPSTNLPRNLNKSNGERAPSLPEFFSLVNQFGWNQASEILNSAKRDYPDAPIFKEKSLTALGYGFLRIGRSTSAVRIFTMLVENFPKSANAYDSLADGYVAEGNKSKAIRNAKIAIKLANEDVALNKNTRERIIKSANDKLKSLKTP